MCAALGSLMVMFVPGHVAAAPIADHTREEYSDSFANNYCGIDGISVISGVDDIKRFSDGTFIDNGKFTETFTAAASQKSIVLRFAAQRSRKSLPIDNGDGTFTFVVSFKGLYEQIKLDHGAVLSIDAGTVTFANTFAVDEDGNGTYLYTTIERVSGPHPEVESDWTLFCDVVVPALI